MKKYLIFIIFFVYSLDAFTPMALFNFKISHYHETEHLIIRTLVLEDVADMFEWCSDARLTTWLTWYPHQNKYQTFNYAKAIIELQKKNKPGWWALVDKKTKKVIGLSGFHEWYPKHKKAEIGIILSPRYWNKGYGTEVIRSIILFAFKETDINRVEALIACHNVGSQKVFEKVGFINEGKLREYKFLKTTFVDHYMLSFLRNNL